MLGPVYEDWNSKVNVISRADMEHFYERHVLHSMAIAKFIRFSQGTKVLDVGTGGGFPGIPLAIMFPETKFVLVDSTRKKIKVVEAVVEAIGLDNVDPRWTRAEEIDEQFDFVVSRAVAPLDKFIPLIEGKIRNGKCAGIKNGLIYLRGDLDEALLRKYPGHQVKELDNWFSEPFFDTKKLVYIPLCLDKV